MRPGGLRRIGGTVGTFVVALGMASLPLSGTEIDGFEFIIVALGGLSFGITGAVILARSKNVSLGWLFAAEAGASGLGLLARSTGGEFADGLASAADWLAITAALAILVGFPAGLSPGWRRRLVAGLFWFMAADASVGSMMAVAVSEDFGFLLFVPVYFLALVMGLAGIARLGLLYRRGGSQVRQQLKFLIFVIVGGGAMLALSLLPGFSSLNNPAGIVLVVGSPVAIGLAILKYRLFEIDRIISRTVGYVLVVGLLGVVYAVGAVWLPSRLNGDSPVFVAGATLAVAALFNPLRRRVLRWVDRRFYRSRYDAERVVEEFSGRLRRLTDMDRLTSDWVEVVTETMQPSAIGVWVRR